MERTVHVFEAPGGENTQACVDLVRDEVENNGFRYVIVASSTGETALKMAEALEGLEANLMVIVHPKGNDAQPALSDANRTKLMEKRVSIFGAPDLSFSLDTAFGSKYAPANPSHVIWQSLRRFGEGMKVCAEIAMMAVDGGLVNEGIEVLSVGGTNSGADTVVVMKAAASKRFQELRVLEILAKPR